ncbi:MAG: hypothetical protein H7Z13_15680 [Ferruginibacter sp.]|nr:hypothetical protein [Ferruginibacter sp.]
MKKITILALAIMLFTACKKDNKVNRPIKLDFTSSVNHASPALTCTLPGTPFAIANSGYFLSGTVTHLGTIDANNSKGQDGFCNLSAAFILTTKTSGQIVAANGDKITYTGDDVINLNNAIVSGGTTAPITGLWTITGGTGKFAGGSGSIKISGIVDLASEGGPIFSISGEGIITY